MAEVKLTFSREEVEAAWQVATGSAEPLPDAAWRKFVLNARAHVHLPSLCVGAIEGGAGAGAAAGSGGGAASAAAALPALCDSGSACTREGCCSAHPVRGALACPALVAAGLCWCPLHRRWHASDSGAFCLLRGWEVSCEAVAPRLRELHHPHVAPLELRRVRVPAGALRRGGYSAGELQAGGYTAEELRAAGYTAEELKGAGLAAPAQRSQAWLPWAVSSARVGHAGGAQ